MYSIVSKENVSQVPNYVDLPAVEMVEETSLESESYDRKKPEQEMSSIKSCLLRSTKAGKEANLAITSQHINPIRTGGSLRPVSLVFSKFEKFIVSIVSNFNT